MMEKMRIYQAETTNKCNGHCSYCPHDKMTRAQGHMDLETVVKIGKYCQSIGQKYLALHHMGEPLMHPNIGLIIRILKSYGIETELSTNGSLIANKGPEILSAGISVVRIAVDEYYNKPGFIKNVNQFIEHALGRDITIRLHTIKGKDLSVFKDYSFVIKEVKPFDNWAGSVEGESTLDKSNDCYFLKYNYCVVLWDGRIVPCCMDWDGKHIIGHIDNIHEIQHKDSYEICKNCAKMQFAQGGKWENENMEGL